MILKKKFFVLVREILRGKSLIRVLMNLELENHILNGKVLDIGGSQEPSYLRFFNKKTGFERMEIDLNAKDLQYALDLEKDVLPFPGQSIDNILLFNILEHIYNHGHTLKECRRVLKNDGEVLGFTPFLVGVHPDPHDYFRYTKESLKKIFSETGFENIHIKEVGLGPLSVNYNNISDYLPVALKLIILPFYYGLDCLLVRFKPSLRQKFPLGYFFKLS